MDSFNFNCGFSVVQRPSHHREGSSSLDFVAFPEQKQWLVFPTQPNSYADWRANQGLQPALREGELSPPERLLQAVWQYQRIQRQDLKTHDGRALRILHPGFLSREGGPDFRGAVVQFENENPMTGDIEVDIQTSGWRAHGHDRNPNFKNVILHVIWQGEGGKWQLPTLQLHQRLDAPLAELNHWLNTDGGEGLPQNLRGLCNGPLKDVSEESLAALLEEAGWVRFQSKAHHLAARARQVGWEQTLWEGLFRGLGYKYNSWPMYCLAEMKSRWSIGNASPETLQARLLGLSGLLPEDLTRKQKSADDYLSRVWDQWWRERDGFADCTLPRTVWRLHGQRPANHPQRRLALASHWVAKGDLPNRLKEWCSEGGKNSAQSLLKLLEVRDEFWSWHWTIRSPRLTKRQPLLGPARVTDLAVNVILPWLWARASEGGNEKLQRTLRERFHAWPASEDNAVLKLARQRLLGESNGKLLNSAARQQGLIQIVRDFCDHSNAICESCRFPELVKSRFANP